MATRIKFGTDGWRAVIADDYTYDNVRVVAQAVADYARTTGLASRGLVVGYDTRFASERFAETVAEVLAGNSIKAYLCSGPTPTPTVSYSILDKRAGGAGIITASHNPYLWNGFKYKPEYAGSASPEVVAALEDNIRRIQGEGSAIPYMTVQEAAQRGLCEVFDAAPAYFRQVSRLVDLPALKEAGLTVVVDAMYGAGSGYLPALLEGGMTKVIQINGERNPYFGGINPEPIAPNLAKLMKMVPQSGSAMGIALDGDADRVGIVDEKGNFVNQLQVFALLTLYLLEVRGWRGPIVKSISATSMVEKLGALYNVPVIETPVGFKYIGPQMMQRDAMIGGEESGGFGFRGHLPERDGMVSGLFIMDMAMRLNRPVSQLLQYLRDRVGDYFYNRVDLHFPPDRGAIIIERLRSLRPVSLDGSKVVNVKTEDGFKYFLDDGTWLLIRFSGTEPIMRIYTETNSLERVDRMLEEGKRLAGL
ncbi:MAG: phosphoglucomutase/phosphomannomutase family protein [Chloroflexi bacterium]|nr:phosphoglucomutase/phosphomannomutase family protein [Chloroflexota bacterium]